MTQATTTSSEQRALVTAQLRHLADQLDQKAEGLGVNDILYLRQTPQDWRLLANILAQAANLIAAQDKTD